MTAAVQKRVPFRVREYMGESGFVAGSWLRNYLSSAWSKRLDHEDYYEDHARLVSQAIDRSTILLAQWAGALDADSPELLLGFAIGERDERGPIVHYVYVKNEYRENGVGRVLVTKLLESLKAEVPYRKTVRTMPRVITFGDKSQAVVLHKLECGHEVMWVGQHDGFECGHCMGRRSVRFTHARYPAEWMAKQLGWRYTPYPFTSPRR